MRSVARLALLLLAASWNSCAGTDEGAPLATPDRAVFDAEVWPVLVRDCGFSACHGSEPRFFLVYGPGHERLDPTMRVSAEVTPAELQISYDRARSMIDVDDPRNSLLLRKPLEVAAGGSGHEGADEFGRDVYRNVDDPSFQVLVRWVLGVRP
jgi:hypothetical protein